MSSLASSLLSNLAPVAAFKIHLHKEEKKIRGFANSREMFDAKKTLSLGTFAARHDKTIFNSFLFSRGDVTSIVIPPWMNEIPTIHYKVFTLTSLHFHLPCVVVAMVSILCDPPSSTTTVHTECLTLNRQRKTVDSSALELLEI